ncbi:MAG: hypothetical protein U0163_00225 [Gemmatimonadaceae bacterium]
MKTLLHRCIRRSVIGLCVSVLAAGALHAQPARFSVPAPYEAVTPFVRMLEDAGITVQRIEDGQQGRVFTGLRGDAFLETSQGDLKIAVFDNDSISERVTVAYSRPRGRQVVHRYQLTGVSLKSLATIESQTPLYFTLHRGWLIETRDGAFDMTIKRALGQVETDAGPVTSRAPR